MIEEIIRSKLICEGFTDNRGFDIDLYPLLLGVDDPRPASLKLVSFCRLKKSYLICERTDMALVLVQYRAS